jgi:hypothetical protein
MGDGLAILINGKQAETQLIDRLDTVAARLNDRGRRNAPYLHPVMRHEGAIGVKDGRYLTFHITRNRIGAPLADEGAGEAGWLGLSTKEHASVP